jgi:glycine amidinotransferase
METLQQPAARETSCPVNSWNGWDPLEEAIVGRLEGATIPPGNASRVFKSPKPVAALIRLLGGCRYPKPFINAAQKQLDGFIHILEAEGVTVRRPEIADFTRRFATPEWRSAGFCCACPRDGFFVIGDEIIETPMSWRSRYFEAFPYRRLFREYFAQGARWTAAPKPQLPDSFYVRDFHLPKPGEPVRYEINEFEPVFDAADVQRCGRDIFYQKSNVSNAFGIAWLERHLGDRFRFHEIESRCPDPLHIDSTLMILAPGKVLVNPEWVDVNRLPKQLRSWDVIVAPQPQPYAESELIARFFSMCSKWISLNVLMLDEKRVIVEKTQTPLIKVLKEHGLEPIACAFTNYLPFGGSFHCATLDIRRRGKLQSYL